MCARSRAIVDVDMPQRLLLRIALTRHALRNVLHRFLPRVTPIHELLNRRYHSWIRGRWLSLARGSILSCLLAMRRRAAARRCLHSRL